MDTEAPTTIANYSSRRIVFAALRRLVPAALLIAFAIQLWSTGFWNSDGPGSEAVIAAITLLIFVVGPALAVLAGLRLLYFSSIRGYLKADHTGLLLKAPTTSLFRTQVHTLQIPWSNIKKVYPFKVVVNMLPASNELRIDLQTGERVAVSSYYFDKSPRQIQLALQNFIEEHH